MALKVLLVEDDRDLRLTLRDALSVEGYEVLTSGSAADFASPSKVPRLHPPLPQYAILAGGDGEQPASSVLHDEMDITYGQAADRFGPDLLGLFDITGLADWSKADKTDYRLKSRDVLINGAAAKEHGWHLRPPF